MLTGLLCGFGALLAAGLFKRELRLWRTREELDGVVFRYSRGRFVRRAVGCALLLVTMAMVFLGLEVIDWRGHLVLLQVHWALVSLFCLALLVLPFLDLRETYRHVTTQTEEKLRAELARARAEGRSSRALKEDRGDGSRP